MRILVAVDQRPYSARAVAQVAILAKNTWADVTLLGVQSRTTSKSKPSHLSSSRWHLDHPLAKALRGYREKFLAHFTEEDCPYLQRDFGYELIEIRKGVWEELYVAKSAKKNLKTRMRFGNPVKEILAESQEEESDLITLGCAHTKGCIWEDGATVPQKVANDASCSVLVVKQERKVERVVGCLDHHDISQQSLEMINQMVTLHQAELDIVGLTGGEGLGEEVENKMITILRYYTARHIQPRIEQVEISSLDSFIDHEAQRSLMALWMGKESMLKKVFLRSKVNKLIKGSKSSVLILR